MAGRREGRPGNVEPAAAGQELVGLRVVLQEVYQLLKLLRVLRAYVGGLTEQVLRVLNASHLAVYFVVAETGVDDDGSYHLAGRLQYHVAAIGHVRHSLHGGSVIRIFVQIEKLAQFKVRRQANVI